MANKAKNSPDEELAQELKNLFEIAPPSYLRKSLTDIFFSYLANTDPKDYNPGIKEIATDFHFLLKFLEKAEIAVRRINEDL